MHSMHVHMQANATMRRTLRPVKPSVTTTGNKMLDIAIRMASTLEQQEKDAADALLAQSVACCTCTCKSMKHKDTTADGFKSTVLSNIAMIICRPAQLEHVLLCSLGAQSVHMSNRSSYIKSHC